MATSKKAPANLHALTEKERQHTLTSLGRALKARDNKETLINLIAALGKASSPKSRRRSSKQELRRLFETKGYVTNDDLDAIAEKLGVKRETVQTALSDLQNPKWANGLTSCDQHSNYKYEHRRGIHL